MCFKYPALKLSLFLSCFLVPLVFGMERTKRPAEGLFALPAKKAKAKVLMKLRVGPEQSRLALVEDTASAVTQLVQEAREFQKSKHENFEISWSCIKLGDLTPEKLLSLGVNYYLGQKEVTQGEEEVSANPAIAREIFTMLEDDPDLAVRAMARVYLGQMHLNGEGGPVDKKRALSYFDEAKAQEHNPRARAAGYFFLGRMAYYGDGVQKNEKYALDCFRYACMRGDEGVQYRAYAYLGQMYYLGKAVGKKDVGEAFKWFVKAFEQNHDMFAKVRAGVCLAQILYLEEIKAVNKEKTKDTIEAAAQRGKPESLFAKIETAEAKIAIARSLFEWISHSKRDPKARALARFWLGHMHYFGKAGKINTIDGHLYYKSAAAQDDNLHVKERAQRFLAMNELDTESERIVESAGKQRVRPEGIHWPSLLADF